MRLDRSRAERFPASVSFWYFWTYHAPTAFGASLDESMGAVCCPGGAHPGCIARLSRIRWTCRGRHALCPAVAGGRLFCLVLWHRSVDSERWDGCRRSQVLVHSPRSI